MSSEEVPPLRSLAAFWCGYDAMFSKDVGDRGAGDDVSEVIEGPEDSGVTPGRVLFREPNDKFADLEHDPGTATAPTSGEVMLQRDELAVPAKNGVGQKQGRDPEESLPTSSLRLHCETATLIVVEARTLRAVQLENDAVLFDQVIDHISLVAIQPTGGRRNENLQRCKVSIHESDRRRNDRSNRR